MSATRINFGSALDDLDAAVCKNHTATLRVRNAGFDESGGIGTSIYACRHCVGAVSKAMWRLYADIVVTELGEPRPAECEGQIGLFDEVSA